MEDASYHRHDIEDRSWDLIKDLLPGQRGQWGGVAEDNRRFIDAVFWVLGTGAPWRDLPPDYGGRKNTHRRFCRWRDKGVRERLPEAAVDDPDFERPMVDSACVKARRGAAGAVGGAEAVGRTKGGPTPRYAWPWMRMACRSDSLSRLVPRRIAGICRSS